MVETTNFVVFLQKRDSFGCFKNTVDTKLACRLILARNLNPTGFSSQNYGDIVMKKTLVTIAVLASFSSAALAASQVTLYGKIDDAVVVNQVRHQDTTVGLESSFLAGSRWGIKGTEDLGNGYSVSFVLEQGFSSDTGNAANSDRAFHRQSTLQVAGDFGAIAFGRMGALSSCTGSYTLVGSDNLAPFDGGYGIIGAFNAGAFVDTGRANNTIAYVSPNFAGLTIAAAYSNGSSDDSAKWSENNHYYGIGAKYNAGAIGAVAVFEVIDQRENNGDSSVGKAIGKDKKAYIGTLGANYDFGVIKPYIGYQYAQQTDVRRQQAFLLGATSPIGGGVAKISAKYLTGKFKGDAAEITKAEVGQKDYDLFQIGAAYEYPISKRTLVYGFGGYAHGNDAASANAVEKLGAKELEGYGGAFGDFGAANLNSWVIAFGIQHNF